MDQQNHPQLQLPPELIELIVDFLHDDKASLAACTLVSHIWMVPSRYHLMRSIKIDHRNLDSFLSLLTSPHSKLSTSVSELTMQLLDFTTKPNGEREYSIDLFPRLIAHFPSLRSLKLFNVSWETLDQYQGFRSISKLSMTWCTLRHINQFYQLVDVFPSVECLEYWVCDHPTSTLLIRPQTWPLLRKLLTDEHGFNLLLSPLETNSYPQLLEVAIFDLSCQNPYLQLLLDNTGNSLEKLKIKYDVTSHALVGDMAEISLRHNTSLTTFTIDILGGNPMSPLSFWPSIAIHRVLDCLPSPSLREFKMSVFITLPADIHVIDLNAIDHVLSTNSVFSQLCTFTIQILIHTNFRLPLINKAAKERLLINFKEYFGTQVEGAIYSGMEKTARKGLLRILYDVPTTMPGNAYRHMLRRRQGVLESWALPSLQQYRPL